MLLQSTGAFKAAARLASATPPPAHVLSRGIGWQVFMILLMLAPGLASVNPPEKLRFAILPVGYRDSTQWTIRDIKWLCSLHVSITLALQSY